MPVLQRARRVWGAHNDRLGGASLTEQERALLTVAVRRFCVAWAADHRLRVALGYSAAVGAGLLAAICLLLPVVVMWAGTAARDASPIRLLLASATYLVIFGVLAASYFHQFGAPVIVDLLPRLGWLGASISTVVALVALALVDEPAEPLRWGLAAGVLAAVLMLASHMLMRVLVDYVFGPLVRRSLGGMPPSWAAAVTLWFLYIRLDDADRPRLLARQYMLRAVVDASWWLEGIPTAMWWARLRGPTRQDARRRFRRAAAHVRQLGWRVLDARSRAELKGIREDVLKAAVAVAAAEWATLSVSDEQAGTSRTLATARRLATPAVLGTAALLLPNLPGVTVTGPAVATFQAALLVAAALNLTPIDARSRDRILDAFSDLR